jgi:aminoglycoside phosphotransferase (APT) family kinase protein
VGDRPARPRLADGVAWFKACAPVQGFEPRLTAARSAERCDQLAAHGIPETVQHDDLHLANLYVRDGRLRVLDWGDASISHPCASLVVTLRFLEEINRLAPADPWFPRLRDAYLEPWGHGLAGTFAPAMRVGAFAHTGAWAWQRDALPDEARVDFDAGFRIVLRRALAHARE